MFKRVLLFMCLVFCFTSCDDLEKEIRMVEAPYENAMYIYGQISKEFGVSVSLRKTKPPYIDDLYYNPIYDSYIDDAKVYLYSEGQKIVEIPYWPQFHYFYMEIDTLDYDSYSIRVESESLGVAYSTEQTLPNKTLITSSNITFDNDNDNRYKADINVLFNSDGESAGYNLNIVNNYWYNSLFSEEMREDGIMSNKMRGLYDKNIYTNRKNTVQGPHMLNNYYYPEKHDTSWISAELYTLSPDYVKFLESEYDYTYSSKDVFFEEVYPLYSNITGGYGLFASFSADVVQYTLYGNKIIKQYK